MPSGEGCKQLLTTFHLREGYCDCVFTERAAAALRVQPLFSFTLPRLCAVELLVTGSQALQEMSFFWRIHTIILSPFGSCLYLPLPALGLRFANTL